MAPVQLVEKSPWRVPDVLAEMRRALAVAPAMEIDVRLNADRCFVVAHGTASPGGKPIAQTHSSELKDVVPLEAALAVLAQHPGPRLVMEIKTLGRAHEHDATASHLVALVTSAGVADRVSVSSLSPAVLLAIHRAWPDVPLILNGALVPVVSYPDGPVGRFLADRLHRGRGYWRVGWRGRCVVLGDITGALRAARDHDAAAAQGETIYAITSVTGELADILRTQARHGTALGGAVSVATVTGWCNVLLRAGLRRLPTHQSKRIVEAVHAEGLNVQTTTWGTINRPTGVAMWRPQTQIRRLVRDGLGDHDVIYTRGVRPSLLKAIGE